MGCKKYGGKGTNGGVWEWTSTVWDKYDGFTPSKLYPGYVSTDLVCALVLICIIRFSADFFDEKHQAVVSTHSWKASYLLPDTPLFLVGWWWFVRHYSKDFRKEDLQKLVPAQLSLRLDWWSHRL